MIEKQSNLPKIMLLDFWHYRWLFILSLVVIFNAVSVVYTSHISRQLTSRWDQLLQQRDKLDIEWRNLLLEEQSQTEHSRITRIATKELHMHRPAPSEEVVVKIP